MKHSLLSPSSAYRWIECQGSIELISKNKIEDTSFSEHALRGTKIHEYARMMLENDPIAIYEELQKTCVVSDDYTCVEEAKNYCDYVNSYRNDGDLMLVEEQVSLEDIHPGTIGHVDAFIVKKERGEIHIFDLKTGYARVSSEKNPQLLLYAYGVYQAYSEGIKTIYLHIVQDNYRLYNTNSCIITTNDLLDFINYVKSKIRRIVDKKYVYKKGEYCKYCPAAIYCDLMRSGIEGTLERLKVVVANHEDIPLEDIMKNEGIDKIALLVAEYQKYEPIIEKMKTELKNQLIDGGSSDYYTIRYNSGRNYYSIPDHKLFLELYEEGSVLYNLLESEEDVSDVVSIKFSNPQKLKTALLKRLPLDETKEILNIIESNVTPEEDIEKIPVLIKKRI